MPPQAVLSNPSPARSRWFIVAAFFALMLISGIAGWHVLFEKKARLVPAADELKTNVYYSPATKSVFAHSTFTLTDEERKLNYRLGKPHDSKEPAESDVLLVEIPYQAADIENATTTGSGKMVFSTESVTEPITHYSQDKKDPQSHHEVIVLTFYYDPATNLLKRIHQAPSTLDHPYLVDVAPDGVRLRFSDSCSACGPHSVGSDQFIWNAETGRYAYIEKPVLEFEWLEGSKYRYKEYVYTDTGGECKEVVGGEVCYLPTDQVEWVQGEIR